MEYDNELRSREVEAMLFEAIMKNKLSGNEYGSFVQAADLDAARELLYKNYGNEWIIWDLKQIR